MGEQASLIFIKQVLEAVNYLHEMKFIHGYLTLKNIYVDENCKVRVMTESPIRKQLMSGCHYQVKGYSNLAPEVLL